MGGGWRARPPSFESLNTGLLNTECRVSGKERVASLYFPRYFFKGTGLIGRQATNLFFPSLNKEGKNYPTSLSGLVVALGRSGSLTFLHVSITENNAR